MFRPILLAFAVAIGLFGSEADDELLAASRKGDLPNVKALLEMGASIESKTSYGQTPLFLAAMNGQLDVVRYLLEKGANTDVQDTFYKAPMLVFVVQRKHLDVAKLLIEKGKGDIDQQLGFIVTQGNADLVQTAVTKRKPTQEALNKTYEQALSIGKSDAAAILKEAGAQEPAPAAQVNAKVLESYAGNYKSDQFPLDIKVSTRDGKLYMQATGQGEFATKSKSPTVFEFAPAGIEVEFDSPKSFVLKQRGATYKFAKAGAQ